MGHRHFSNTLQMPESEIDQDCYRSRGTAERSYIHMGIGALNVLYVQLSN
jgi:hypothetical protein